VFLTFVATDTLKRRRLDAVAPIFTKPNAPTPGISADCNEKWDNTLRGPSEFIYNPSR
jgi:hypothetical protein